MSDTMTLRDLEISETGLKLIKAFEGYRPVDRELVTGQRVVGYGHRLYSDDAVTMNKSEAQDTLMTDLAPFQDMINSEVHAPLTQSQYDALCSFAYNIGPKAFLESDTLRALNNGRPLDAANGLDIWRKSEIAGKTYVVDALMRRRTAEKALFLRTERALPAGREDLPPVADTSVAALSTEDALPVFTQSEANGVVATAPYEATQAPQRRREDGPAGVLELSTRDEVDATLDIETPVVDLPRLLDVSEEPEALSETSVEDAVEDTNAELRESPIASAATDIVSRLEALIEDAGEMPETSADFPESLIQSDDGATSIETTENDNTVVNLYEGSIIRDTPETTLEPVRETPLPLTKTAKTAASTKAPTLVIDALAEDDAMRRTRPDSAAKYIVNTPPVAPQSAVAEPAVPSAGGAGLWIPVLTGFILLGASLAALLSGAYSLMGDWGEVLAFTGTLLGGALILVGIYAALRITQRG